MTAKSDYLITDLFVDLPTDFTEALMIYHASIRATAIIFRRIKSCLEFSLAP